MKKGPSTIHGTGKRLAGIRRARGLTQRQLSKLTGISNRMIAYYEVQTEYPPAHLLLPLTKALRVSTDELLGIKDFKDTVDKKEAALWRNLKKATLLPKTDQQTLVKNLKDLLAKNRIKIKKDSP